MVLGLAFAIGVVAGLRSFTAPAAVCWAAHLGWLRLTGFVQTTAAVYISSALAVMELVLDKTPWIGARTRPGSLIFRLFTGGLSGAALGGWMGAALGILGALVGTYAGYYARRWMVSTLKVPDIAVALLEDVIAVGGAFLIVSRS